MMEPVVYCVDVGSIPGKRFAWARGHRDAEVTDSQDIAALASAAGDDLARGWPVALGFECPLYVPLREDPMRLTSARANEGTYAWSAGVGASVLVTGLTEVVWVLREIRRCLSAPVPVGLDWTAFEVAGSGLFLWEAFITGIAKGKTDREDARIGVQTFCCALPTPRTALPIHEAEEVYSLVGAALLRAGWSTDVSLLSAPCLVLKAPERPAAG